MNRFNRPAAVTAILIVCSFGCGVAGAVVIGMIGERTKRKQEVSRRIWALLKSDEAALELRKKEMLDHELEMKESEKQRKKAPCIV